VTLHKGADVRSQFTVSGVRGVRAGYAGAPTPAACSLQREKSACLLSLPYLSVRAYYKVGYRGAPENSAASSVGTRARRF